MQGTDGNFYGTAEGGGSNGVGVVFKITPSGKLTVLYNFDYTHGSIPYGGLTLGTDGNFYGTTGSGGTRSYGTVFKITPAGKPTVLHSMNGTTDGIGPVAVCCRVVTATSMVLTAMAASPTMAQLSRLPPKASSPCCITLT